MAIGTDDLGALIASRICHDLVSPMGAVSNGLELLGLARTANGPELDLISASIDSATTRLRFYRIAFGMVSEGQLMGGAELRSILSAMSQQQRQSYHWHGATEITRAQAKLAFLLIMCLETALPFGGEIHVSDLPGGWRLEARSARLRHETALWENVTEGGSFAAITSARIQFPLARHELTSQGLALHVHLEQDGLALDLTGLPA